MNSEKHLAANLRALRRAAGLKQHEIAGRLHVSPQTVSKWEQGSILPDLTNLCRLSEIFSVGVDVLLRESRERPPAFLGVDGGGTKTDLALCGDDGTVLRSITLGPCNPTVCGIKTTVERLNGGIDALGAADYDLRGAFFGIAGCTDDARRGAIRDAFSSRFPGVPVDAGADIVNVIWSTPLRENCVAAICGTGSVAFASKNGRTFRVGGWGPVFDNAGSGLDVARDALRAALAEEDGFGPVTVLTPMLRQRLGECLFDAIASLDPTDFSRVAALSPLVFEAERSGDAVASSILARNFERLAFLINTAAARYDCRAGVILAGGVTANREAIGSYLVPRLASGLTLTLPDAPPVIGALNKARSLCGRNEQTMSRKENRR